MRVGLRDLLRRDKSTSTDDLVDEDAAVFETLIEAGADLSQPREVVHYVHLPSREAAETFAPMVANLGFEPRIQEPGTESADQPRPWTVAAVAGAVVDHETMAAPRRS